MKLIFKTLIMVLLSLKAQGNLALIEGRPSKLEKVIVNNNFLKQYPLLAEHVLFKDGNSQCIPNKRYPLHLCFKSGRLLVLNYEKEVIKRTLGKILELEQTEKAL